MKNRELFLSQLILFLCVLFCRGLPKSLSDACEESCDGSLGMESQLIEDSQITASSAFNHDFATYGPQRARLNLASWPWGYRANPAELESSWIKVNLGTEKVITGLATQGYGDTAVMEWVTSYSVMYRSKLGVFSEIKTMQGGSKQFRGNRDSNSIKYHDIPIPVLTSEIIILPQTWVDNIGLRLELYGCDPGYYFLVWWMFDGQFFTTKHADVTSQEHNDTRDDTLVEIENYLRVFPGFLSVEFMTLSPHISAFGYTVLNAEMKILCLKSSENNLLAKLNTEKRNLDVSFRFPSTCQCLNPQVNISLRKTLKEAAVLYTTQNITIYAETSQGNCNESFNFKWEIAKASDKSSDFRRFAVHGDPFNNKTGKLQLKGREFGEGYLYIRCVAFTITQSGNDKVETYDYGYVRVAYPSLVAQITGSSAALKGNGSVKLDASSSYDPNSRLKNSSGLSFSWYCKRLNGDVTKEGSSGCYGHHSGKLRSTRPFIEVDVDSMDANQTYLFELVITKDRRVSRAIHALAIFPPYVISLRCTINCGSKVSTSKRMIIEATCSGPYCLEDISYSWALYQFTPFENSPSWLKVQNLESYTLTNLDNTNIVFSGSRKPLAQRSKYKLVASALLPEGIVETGEMIFDTNSPPSNPNYDLGCGVHPKKGRVLKTKFNVTCYGWEDEDLPLTYQLSYQSAEGLVIISGGNESSFITGLPQGNKSENYLVELQVSIFDSLGDAYTVQVIVQVVPLSSKAEVKTAVSKAISGPNSTTANLLRSGKLQSATLMSYFTLTATDGVGLSSVETNSVKDEVLRHLAVSRPQILREVTQLSAVVNKATHQRINMTINAVSNAAALLQSMTNRLKTEARHSQDVDVIQQVGAGLLNGMSYVLNILTKNEPTGEKQIGKAVKSNKQLEKFHAKFNQEKPTMIEESVALMDKLGSALLSTKVVGESEPSVFKTEELSMVLDRQTPSVLERKPFQATDGHGGISFPSRKALIKNFPFPLDSLDVQLIAFGSNPFLWDITSKNVTSDVLDINIKTNGSDVHFSQLDEPFELFIPLKEQKKQGTDDKFFVKWSNSFENIRYHKIIIPSDGAVAIIDIVPEENNFLDIFISAGFRPTPENHTYTTHVPDYSNCREATSSNDSQQCSSITPYRLLVSSSLTGALGDHYVGILLHKNSSEGLRMNDMSAEGKVHRRHSRSICNSLSGRKKRSCIGVKDNPNTPPPKPEIIKPPYNSTVDVNYTMSVWISSCLYWSKEKKQWTNDGCKVGLKTNKRRLHCLCTHLSAFGGDFFVAANPIDFDKVWDQFGAQAETGNFVMAVVFCIYGVYFVSLVLARHADKKDQDKFVANVVLSGCNPRDYTYEIQIQTGIWQGCGTTANVGINIFGEEGSSGAIILTDFSLCRKVFYRGGVTNFFVSLPRCLGKLVKLWIWHDNFGQSPSWFLQQVTITESRSRNKWHFFANRWIAVERGSGNLFLELAALGENDPARFKDVFCSKISGKLGDEHLWVSLFTRPPNSQFTRCQRLSCCLSFLFSSMVANAMFYQFSERPTHTFKFGLMVLSWRQIMIGIQSGLITIPVNMVIVTIFRNVKVHLETDHDPNLSFPGRQRACRLPHCFVFIAWSLCISVTLTSSAFTVFYSLSWGADISNQWLTSIFVSLVEDAIIIQPVKTIFLAMILSLVIKTLPGKEDVCGSTIYINKEQEYHAPNEHLLSKAKEFGKKLLQMSRAIRNVAAFLIFSLMLMMVCYGNRDSRRFAMTKSVKDIFIGFEKVTEVDSFWVWARHELIPGLYHVSWYNGQPFNYKEGFISNREAFLIGLPRLRQIRLKPETRCHGDADILQLNLKQIMRRCLLPYCENNEDKSQYYQPRWIAVKNLTTAWNKLELDELCPKPWRYQSRHLLQTMRYKGVTNIYDGGGYVADLGYNEESALGVISELQNHDWINEFTAAVFIEFSVHEPSSRLFSSVKYLYERLPTGGVLTSVNVQTLPLYPPFSGDFLNTLYELSHQFLVVCILILVGLEIKEIIHQKRAYFRQFWNWLHIMQILTSTFAVIIGLLKANQASFFVKRVQQNPYGSSSLDRIAMLSDYENYLLALVTFTITIRLLKLFKFNRQIGQMARTLRRSQKSLISFAVVFGNSLLAFTVAGVLTFGATISSFSSFYHSFATVVRMTVGGSVNFPDVKLDHQSLGPFFLSMFVIWMVFILVNVLVAILVDFYQLEREDAMCSDDSLASFMYSYFTAKADKLLKSFTSNITSKVERQRKRKSCKRSELKITTMSEPLQNPLDNFQIARSQSGMSQQEAESIIAFQEFGSFLQEGGLSEKISKSDSSFYCLCNKNKVIYPDHETSNSERVVHHFQDTYCNAELPNNTNNVEETLSTSNADLFSNDRRNFRNPVTSHSASIEILLGLNDLDIDHVKSNIFDVALELKDMFGKQID